MEIKKRLYHRGKRRKLKKSVRWVIFLAVSVMLLLIFVPSNVNIFNRSEPVNSSGRVDFYRDRNALHLRYAQVKGIPPIVTEKNYREKIETLAKKKSLVKISDNQYYVLKKLTHSHPYLVPEAAALLEIIGKRFQQKMADRNMEKYLFRVSSVLRTKENQGKLRGSNGNATTNSSHFYGTSFDITYKNLVRKTFFGRKMIVSNPAAIRILSETIGELRKEKHLVVVTEKKEACFHITVR